MKKRAVAIISGGMDSCVAAKMIYDEGYDLIGVHFNYGQRTQERELKAFRDICDDLSIVARYELDLNFFATIGGSALTDRSIDVPTEGLTPGVPVTYVPFRNGIFLSIAGAIAEKEGASAVVIGVVQEDSSGYPDCTGDFIKDFERTLNEGTKQETKIGLKTPLIHLTKGEIVLAGIACGVNLSHTWSCYQNEEQACGVCDSCRLRLKGFQEANAHDEIPYVVTL